MRKTKIICTLGPATDSPERLRALILAGANIFRLNMSHAPHEWVRTVVKDIRKISTELGVMTGILLDTQGPAIRTGDLPTKLNLRPGDIFEFTVRGERSEDVHSVDVNYEGLVDDISVGDVVLVDNGVIHMKVLSKDYHRIRCQVLTEGVLGSRRHINLPGVKVNLPPLTEKDLADVELGVSVGVDYVALSFCRQASDIEALRRVLGELGSQARVIAKIEDQHAVSVIDDIMEKCDAIDRTRRLGIEPMEEPDHPTADGDECIQTGRQVIVAPHMLESMIENPVPTRRTPDVANAVFEQADAIMLAVRPGWKVSHCCVGYLIASPAEWSKPAGPAFIARLRRQAFATRPSVPRLNWLTRSRTQKSLSSRGAASWPTTSVRCDRRRLRSTRSPPAKRWLAVSP